MNPGCVWREAHSSDLLLFCICHYEYHHSQCHCPSHNSKPQIKFHVTLANASMTCYMFSMTWKHTEDQTKASHRSVSNSLKNTEHDNIKDTKGNICWNSTPFPAWTCCSPARQQQSRRLLFCHCTAQSDPVNNAAASQQLTSIISITQTATQTRGHTLHISLVFNWQRWVTMSWTTKGTNGNNNVVNTISPQRVA